MRAIRLILAAIGFGVFTTLGGPAGVMAAVLWYSVYRRKPKPTP